MARRRNLGGFSWKRLAGITRAKQGVSRKTGIPWSKTGRQRKIGKAMGGCLVLLLVFAVAVAAIFPVYGYVLNTSTKKIHADSCSEIEKMDENNYQYSDTSSVPGYTVCLKCFANDGSIKPPARPGVRPVVPTAPTQVRPTATANTADTNQSVPAGTWQPGQPIPATESKEKPPVEWGWQKVERVVDGDTLLLKNGQRVRLIGADTPETVKPNTPVQPFGLEATEYTKAFMTLGENWVFLEEDGDIKDKYDRQLAMVWIKIPPFGVESGDSVEYLLNNMLILSGLARAQTQYNYSKEMKEFFQQSENKAKSRKVGIWSTPL